MKILVATDGSLPALHAVKYADEDHPYGHQRFEIAASLVLGA